MNKRIFLPLAAALVATPVLADSKHGRRHHDDDRHYAQGSDYAQVISAQPIYSSVRVGSPRQECWDERVVYREPARNNGYQSNDAAGALIGGILGGVAGHQFGGGSGRNGSTLAALGLPYRPAM